MSTHPRRTDFARVRRQATLACVAALVSTVAVASSVSVSTLGFDPSRFGLPIYPGTTVKLGGTASGKDFSGRSQRSVVLETSDSVDAVANWYAMNWAGAMRKTYPGAPIAMFSKVWGTTAVTVTVGRDGTETDISIVVPGSY
jgi:hypothetical protein